MSDKIVVKEIDILDVYNELQDVKSGQESLSRKLDEYNGLREKLDKIEANCAFNVFSEDGAYNKLRAKILEAERQLLAIDNMSKGKGLLSHSIVAYGLFIVAIFGGLTGFIHLLTILLTSF